MIIIVSLFTLFINWEIALSQQTQDYGILQQAYARKSFGGGIVLCKIISTTNKEFKKFIRNVLIIAVNV